MKKDTLLPVLVTILLAGEPICGKETATVPELQTVMIESSLDGSEQPSRVYIPDHQDQPMPLLVLLHTWSGGYKQNSQISAALAECKQRNWAMIFPHFRGPNWTPEACASTLAIQDVIDAVGYVREHAQLDRSRIYVCGMSGGGHMTLVMTTRAPHLWAAASAWVPISDVRAWHAECIKAGRGYATHMVKACGGKPGDSRTIDAEYRWRSSLPFFDLAKGMAIDINAGIHDGHSGSVPISHSLRAFNALAEVNGAGGECLSEEEIREFTEEQHVPKTCAGDWADEPGRQQPVLFRRSAGRARVTIFEGGHQGDIRTAIRWLAIQRRPRTPAGP